LVSFIRFFGRSAGVVGSAFGLIPSSSGDGLLLGWVNYPGVRNRQECRHKRLMAAIKNQAKID
jgi:hypothetical protein